MATKAQTQKFNMQAGEHERKIIRILQDVSRRAGLDRVWSDWVEMGAIALAIVDLRQREEREKRYMEIVRSYEREDVELLTRAFAHLVMVWEERQATGVYGDVLGSLFMMLDMGNAGTGQFFTPYEISHLMAKISIGEEARVIVERQGYISVQEPACGAGGMAVAAAHALSELGLSYQKNLHVTAIDVDSRCVHMTYLQLALLHIPAVVIHGNALTLQTWGHWFTPAHILGGWGRRLGRRAVVTLAPDDAPSNARDETPPMLSKALELEQGQISLF